MSIVQLQKNVLRGFHFQTKLKQSKYVNVVKGKILDVVIDLRKNSKTFGRTFKIILSKKMRWVYLYPRDLHMRTIVMKKKM